MSKHDLRVRRTRMSIQKAFNELLDEKGFQAITVQEIADRAMINRATFYDHFADKYALFEYTMRETFRETLREKLPADFTYCATNVQFLIATLCEFIAEIEDHCRHTNTQGMPPFNEQVTELLSELLIGWFEQNGTGQPAESLALTAQVASWAMYGAAHHWSEGEQDTPAEDFAVGAAPMIEAILQQVEGVPAM